MWLLTSWNCKQPEALVDVVRQVVKVLSQWLPHSSWFLEDGVDSEEG